MGETATVCSRVADARYQETRSHVTFLNFDRPYPDHTFTTFLPADKRAKFGTPEKRLYRPGDLRDGEDSGIPRPEIILTDPQQIKADPK